MKVVSPLPVACTERCPAALPAPAALVTSTDTSGVPSPLAKRPPGLVLALPAFS